MKCDELNAHYISTRSGNSCCCYFKYEVDAAIAELKQKLEDEKASNYTESVDAGMRERKLKHWLKTWSEVQSKCQSKVEEYK